MQTRSTVEEEKKSFSGTRVEFYTRRKYNPSASTLEATAATKTSNISCFGRFAFLIVSLEMSC